MTRDGTAMLRALGRWVCCAAVLLLLGAASCESKPPETPGEVPPGNCCMRNAEPSEQVCGARVECCRGGLDRDECEAKQGIWFHSTEGCRGAC